MHAGDARTGNLYRAVTSGTTNKHVAGAIGTCHCHQAMLKAQLMQVCLAPTADQNAGNGFSTEPNWVRLPRWDSNGCAGTRTVRIERLRVYRLSKAGDEHLDQKTRPR